MKRRKRNEIIWILIVCFAGLIFYLNHTPKANRGNETMIVVSRELGSGTRGAFVDLVGVEDEHGDDAITVEADVLNSTSGVLQTVKGNKFAIGYVSFGSINDDVTTLKIDGVMPSAEAVKNGTYPIARPFILAWRDALSPLGEDFFKFIFSNQGQQIVEELGYISVRGQENDSDSLEYTASDLRGNLNIVGSTSLTPILEKMAEDYMKLNTKTKISITSNGSSAGIEAVIEGSADLGMSSRELTHDETAKLNQVSIALDGIVLVTNKANRIANLSLNDVNAIYGGNITDWSDIK